MIENTDKQIIKEISQKYKIKRVILFGSSLDNSIEGNDIDIAIEGISPQNYYKFCGELMCLLSRPVDIIDLSNKSRFSSLVKEEGQLIYG